MPYGQGKMIGDTVDPRLFMQDYSGVADIGRIQGQGYAALGQGIGTAIEKLGDYKKQQSEQEKAVKRADTIASLIEKQLPEFAGEVAPIRAQLGDKNIPLKDRFAAAESINDILNIGTQIKKLQLDEAQVMASIGARSQQKPLAEWEIINVPAEDGSLIMAERNKFTGEIRRPDFSGLSGGGMPQYMGGGTTDINDPSAWSQDPTLDALDPSMIDIPGQPVASPQEFQGVTTSFMLPQERVAQQISSAENIQVNPPAGTTGPFDASGNYIEAAADMKVRPQANPQQAAQAPAQAAPQLGMTPAKQPKGQRPFTQMTIKQIQDLQAQNISVEATPNPDGTYNVYSTRFGPPRAGETITTDPKTGIVTITRGGTAAIKAAEAAEKKDEAARIKSTRVAGLVSDLNYIKEQYKAIEPQKGVVGSIQRIITGKIPGTDTRAVRDTINRVNSIITLDGMQTMRSESPTGGLLGNVSDKDIQILQDAASSLSLAQTPASFDREWLRLNQKILDTTYGSEKQRAEWVKSGKITEAQNAEIESLYPSEKINVKGEIVPRGGKRIQVLGLSPEVQRIIEENQ